ncbi:hypothetical protein SAMN05421665_3083 [Yoonia rosea]|uniref:Uncharacterized protein n=1 Tax=Yoonia rosea TaxID=287098 RepID=A0A1R3XG47_9RHOB|nr:hypothetical protein SAMN05421665_3083 [Yoonia rosea]
MGGQNPADAVCLIVDTAITATTPVTTGTTGRDASFKSQKTLASYLKSTATATT